MASNLFGKMASDTLGISDIGTIIEPKDFNMVDGDDYIMHEDGEKIFFVIKSKADEHVFTNRALIHVNGDTALSKKKVVTRYDYRNYQVSGCSLETAGNIDLDVEIKFSFGKQVFAIDVDKKQLEQLKDLYKTLVEIEFLQHKNNKSLNDATQSLTIASQTINRCTLQGSELKDYIETLTKFNYAWLTNSRDKFNNKDFTDSFMKYINN